MILAVGLTPAWQQILTFRQFALGEVNRAEDVIGCASGKVLNVGCALHHLGVASHTLSPVGGRTGELIRTDFDGLGVPATWIETQSSTRVCTTLLDRSSNQTTELVENSAPLTHAELDAYRRAFVELIPQARMIVVSGSLPKGTPTDFFAELLDGVSVPVLLDIRGPELLACLPRRPWLVKPNRDELATTFNRPLATDDELLAAIHELRSRGAEHVVVSDGPQAVWSAGPEGVECSAPPEVDIVNPIGCGDCLAAGMAAAWSEARSWPYTVQFGIATAAENARHLLPARFPRGHGW
ncbi:MAG TPA: 1-phosphofructokinase family hexose kinase [Planctomycetaceae bacterium]|nr:1-phosphofructokinase family hexose kinase [Planctomycetaceae bacterium]